MNASAVFYSSTSNTLVKISLYEYGAVSFVKSQIKNLVVQLWLI